jgi:protocatechuate 3,4-dioxygenase beta subunit
MSHHRRSLLGRRNFLRRSLYGAAGLSVFCTTAGCGPSTAALLPPTDETPEPGASVATLSKWGEAGAPLVVRGHVYAADGKTPVGGVRLYVYHTDARGLYSDNVIAGPPRPRIKGYVRTDRGGAYEFRTTRPGSYPGSRNPQHIHASVSGPGQPERYIDEYWFDDDPFVTDAMRAKHKDDGAFSPILRLTRDAAGVFHATRDIRL